MVGFGSNNPFRHAGAAGGNNIADDVPPPPGPPPSHSHQQGDYAPPPGPPPSHSRHQVSQGDYAPPPGPPPSYNNTITYTDNYAPPPGPPPSQAQHDWQSLVPDTSLFPPPPALFSGFDRSSASNASEDQAEEGERWCRLYPLVPPMNVNQQWQFHSQQDPSTAGVVSKLVTPETNSFRGRVVPKDGVPVQGGGGGTGVWSIVTEKKSEDAVIIGYPPVYMVGRDSPLLLASSTSSSSQPNKKTIYYEVKILGPDPSSSSSHHHHFFHRSKDEETGPNNKEGEIGLAVGFTALPYPPFRMPGWHRGSLAVHGDDGNRYINDRWGGKEFTKPFTPGQTVGIGMTFSSASSSGAPPSYSASGKGKGGGSGNGRIDVEVFLTRDGKVDGRWDIHEELDADTDLPVTGLEGYHDLAIAVGTYKNVAVEVVLDPAKWIYTGV